jgi:hypothetical protein
MPALVKKSFAGAVVAVFSRDGITAGVAVAGSETGSDVGARGVAVGTAASGLWAAVPVQAVSTLKIIRIANTSLVIRLLLVSTGFQLLSVARPKRADTPLRRRQL